MMATVLLLSIFLPLLGAVALSGDRETVRSCALTTALLTLAAAGVLVLSYPAGADGFAAVNVPWLGGAQSPIDIRFHVGLDGLSLWLFGLTALLTVTAVLAGWESVKERATAYYRLLLVLETGLLGALAARDMILFYVFLECTLIPLFLLIGGWGNEQRRYAATKFLLYTFLGSLLMLLGLLSIAIWNYRGTGVMTFSIPELVESLSARPLDTGVQLWIFLALFAGFAVKVPLFPLHSWLPSAQAQAPTAASMMLTGALLNLGIYGFLRFSLPMLPDATAACAPWILWLSVAGAVWGALVALAQKDIKRLIAYGTLSQLGFCMLGVFAINRSGMEGGLLLMMGHGLSAAGLFAIAGMLYERYGSRRIADLRGAARQMPRLAMFVILMALASAGLPGTSGFAAGVRILAGTFKRASAEGGFRFGLLAAAVSAVVLGALYVCYLLQRLFSAPIAEPSRHGRESVRDLSAREVMALAPLAVFILWIGLYPDFFIRKMAPTLDRFSATSHHEAERGNQE